MKIILTLLSLFLISIVSGLKIPPPATLESATFYSPLHIARSFLNKDPSSLQMFREVETQRVGIWQRPILAVILGAHTALMIYFLWKIRAKQKILE